MLIVGHCETINMVLMLKQTIHRLVTSDGVCLKHGGKDEFCLFVISELFNKIKCCFHQVAMKDPSLKMYE